MKPYTCALRIAFVVSLLGAAFSSAGAGPLGLFPLKKSEPDVDTAPRSVYARGQGAGNVPYQTVAAKSKKPNVFQRMGQGTRNFFGATKDALTFNKKPAPKQVGGKTNSWTPKKTQQKKSSSWFGSWFKKKEPEKPQTMKQWLQQDRVDY